MKTERAVLPMRYMNSSRRELSWSWRRVKPEQAVSWMLYVNPSSIPVVNIGRSVLHVSQVEIQNSVGIGKEEYVFEKNRDKKGKIHTNRWIPTLTFHILEYFKIIIRKSI